LQAGFLFEGLEIWGCADEDILCDEKYLAPDNWHLFYLK